MAAVAMLATAAPATGHAAPGARPSPSAQAEPATDVIVRHDDGSTEVVAVPPAASAWATAARLARDPGVAYAEPDVEIRTFADPGFDVAWGLHNTGQGILGTVGTADVDVDAPEAWEVTTGSPDVVVAVVDTGVDIDHPDLAGSLWVNEAEQAGQPGVDDDGNGYVDDVHGWDFVDGDADVRPGTGSDVHGTHIAGVIGAREDGAGVTGLAPDVTIMPLRFADDEGVGSASAAIAAIEYAAANGARVINASWGSDSASQALHDTIADAGLAVVAAAGNAGEDLATAPVYPAAYDLPNVLGVTAVDNRGRLPGWANTGEEAVDVGAPGVDIISTLPGGGHGYVSGTSMATPFAAATAALVATAHTSATGAALVSAVRAGAEPLSALAGVTATGGLVNAPAALAAATGDDGDDAPATDGTADTAEASACPQDEVVEASFEDVDADSVHRDAIDCVTWWGIAAGRSADAYDPAQPLTRAQMATFLVRVLLAADVAIPAGEGVFSDLGGSVHAADIEGLAALGVVDGFGGGVYGPDRRVTRAQMSAYLVRTWTAITGSRPPDGDDAFGDDDGSVHERDIDATAAAGWAHGVGDGAFAPRGEVRRDQMASFLQRLLESLVADGLVAPPA